MAKKKKRKFSRAQKSAQKLFAKRVKEAKKIKKANPKMKWNNAVKQAAKKVKK